MGHLCDERPVDYESGLRSVRGLIDPPQLGKAELGAQCASLRSLRFASPVNPAQLSSATMVFVLFLMLQPLIPEL